MLTADETALVAQELGSNPSGYFGAQTLFDALQEPDPPEDWIIDKLLAAGAISLFTGKPFCGKSTFVRSMLRAVSRGEKVLGRATKRVPVGYITFEGGRRGVKDRFKQLQASLSETDKEYFYFFHGRPPREHAVEELRAFIDAGKLKLVVIDPGVLMLISDLKGDSEPGYVKMYAALEPFAALARETNCHLAFIWHMGKTDRDALDQTLGSTASNAAVDTMFMFRRIKEGQRTLEIAQRDGEELAPTVLKMDENTGAVGIGVPVKAIKIESKRDALLGVLARAAGWIRLAEIRKQLKGNGGYSASILKGLVGDGKVEMQGKAVKGSALEYRLKTGATDDAPKKRRFQK
jgi:hypothetical protein